MTAPITPVEHCGHLMPDWVAASRSECVLRPGHSGSHADDRGARWWYDPENIDWRQRADEEQQRADRAEAEIAACRRQQWPQQLARTAEALRQALDCIIYGNGQPRDPNDLTRWRAALNLQEQPRV